MKVGRVNRVSPSGFFLVCRSTDANGHTLKSLSLWSKLPVVPTRAAQQTTGV